jgi:hypothetical protein
MEHRLDAVWLLLQGMFHCRMESRGLDLWKCKMQRMLRSMAAPEWEFATRDMLDMLRETVREYAERTFPLDLAVWRTSCAHEEDPSSKLDALGRDRRVRCGSRVIVRDVISFLENGPVEDVIRKMVDSSY